MEIIRGRLSSADADGSTSTRYNPDTDTVQYTPDGGITWVNSPADDPRHGAKFAKPLKTTGDVACDSAASMVAWIKNFIDYEADVLETGAKVVGIANLALSFLDILGPYAILATKVIALAGDLFGLGAIALNSSFTDETYDAMLCCFVCNIESDGTVTAGDLETIQAKINDDLNTIAAFVTNTILSIQGEVGLQNAGTLYDVTGDCSECLCMRCHVFNAAEGWGAVYSAGGYATLVAGVWQSGAAGGAQICAIAVDLVGIDLRHVVVKGNADDTANGGTRGLYRIVPFNQFYAGSTAAGDITYDWYGTETGDFTMQANLDSISHGNTTINQLELYGFWPDELFGADNC